MKRSLVALLILCGFWGSSIATAGGATVTYIYTDGQGSPVAEADGAGNITATFDYTPFGSTLLGAQQNGPGFTGHVADPDTSLTYMQARYYDPSIGQFLSVDPVLPATGSVSSLGAYAYAENNPIRYVDPTGAVAEDGQNGEVTKDIPKPPPPEKETPKTLGTVTVTAPVPRAIQPPKVAIRRPPIWIGKLSIVLLILADANTVHDDIYGRKGCYGAVYCSKESDVPSHGPAGEWVDGRRRSRKYNDKGEPEVDLDKPHQGAPEPHAHNWVDGIREHPGVPYSPVGSSGGAEGGDTE